MRRTAETSRAAFATLEPTLPARAADVLDALQRYRGHHRSDPTAYELLRWMQIEQPTLDLNGVRPRLTELRDAGRVRTTGKRVCTVTERCVFTWAAVTPAPVLTPYEPRPHALAVQEGLF